MSRVSACLLIRTLMIAVALINGEWAVAQQDTGAGKDWIAIGGGPGSLHYSKLKQINRDNVKDLEIAWTFDTGDGDNRTDFESTPLEVDGVIYLIGRRGQIFALDAATGKQMWALDPLAGKKTGGNTRNRGISYWTVSVRPSTGLPDRLRCDWGTLKAGISSGKRPRQLG